MKHIIYRTHNLINQKEYTGKHSTDNLDDGYYGSGILIKRAVAKYGIGNFAVEILSYHDTSKLAFIEEELIVNDDYVDRDDTYNLILGGDGNPGWSNKNRIIVKDKLGNIFQIDKNDKKWLSREVISIHKGMVPVKDKSGNTMSVSVDDPRYLSGELVHINVGRTCPGKNKGKVTVKDKSGNTMSVSVDDPRYLSGELVGVMKGRKTKARSKPNKKMQLFRCPHCNKEGRGWRMQEYHFDNCKSKYVFP